jgi:hypothetical protein
MTNEKSVSCILSSVARNLLKVDVTWAKIASLYCVAGGLAVDCVRQVGQHLNLIAFPKMAVDQWFSTFFGWWHTKN